MTQGTIVIVGGGIAGLWLCDALRRRGDAVVVLESAALGTGQTIGSQGIIHGGVKYALAGAMSESAANIGEMPGRWLASLAGRVEPDLRQARLRATHCHLWQTAGLSSGLGMLGARLTLEVTPRVLDATHRPAALRGCPGTVAQLDEPVVDPGSVLAALANRNAGHLFQVAAPRGIDFALDHQGRVTEVLVNAGPGTPDRITVATVVLAAGEGNAELRRRVGLDPGTMQRRPLQMVMVRGALPELNGHCIDGGATRASITTVTDSAGRRVWLVGGLVAEQGAAMTAAALKAHAREELEAIVPGVSMDGLEWATWRVDRAERATADGRRPDDVQFLVEGNVITAWPTKLALAPRLADRLVALIPAAAGPMPLPATRGAQPPIALPPWETEAEWTVAP